MHSSKSGAGQSGTGLASSAFRSANAGIFSISTDTAWHGSDGIGGPTHPTPAHPSPSLDHFVPLSSCHPSGISGRGCNRHLPAVIRAGPHRGPRQNV